MALPTPNLNRGDHGGSVPTTPAIAGPARPNLRGPPSFDALAARTGSARFLADLEPPHGHRDVIEGWRVPAGIAAKAVVDPRLGSTGDGFVAREGLCRDRGEVGRVCWRDGAAGCRTMGEHLISWIGDSKREWEHANEDEKKSVVAEHAD